MVKNANLHNAKRAKNDEFYTQWIDIEKEMMAYLDYDPDLFRDKTILLPCDDPAWSNFTKFFALNFDQFGIKKLISTSYAPASNPAFETYEQYAAQFEPAETDDARFDAEKHWTQGRIYVIDRDMSADGRINIDDLEWEYLEGDGDFRSDEVTALRDEADMVITNPPFSLFREFVPWLMEGGVQFAIIGNQNALTFKEIFPLIKEQKLWLGNNNPPPKIFEVPDHIAHNDNVTRNRSGQAIASFGNIRWFANIEHGRRHTPMRLMNTADNLRFGPKKIREQGYPKYDNYDAIEVAEKIAIPSDYAGVMGVPITFLGVYCPEQFEIIGSFNAGAHGEEVGAVKTPAIIQGQLKLWNGPVVNKKPLYKRILIRHLNPDTKDS